MYKCYYNALIALEERNRKAFAESMEKEKDPFYRNVPEIQEKAHNGMNEEALDNLEQLLVSKED
ncbi:hypothetical protein [Bacillus sp. REN3]|uniref:hypothetical protein n=1 Tax=Bacillus sp. REN3 TaxID=2802440 RepID=UPI001AEF296B|nr:hypothetical protein [Bacillus sp. REN3]